MRKKEEKLTERIIVMISKKQKDKINERINNTGILNVSDYIRKQIDKDV